MKSVANAALAVLGGVLWAWCFANEGSVWLPWLALVPLVHLSRQRRAVAFGLLHGFVCWLVSVFWIIRTLASYGGLSLGLSIFSLGLLSLYLGSFHAAFAGVGRRIWQRQPTAVIWALPALWVVLELVRAHLFSGFPWNLAAYAVVDVPGALELSPWIGAYGVSFLVVAANVAFLLLVQRLETRRAAVGMLAVVTLFISFAVSGRQAQGRESREVYGGSSRGDERAEESDRSPAAGRQVVSVVQPNTPIATDWDSERFWRDFRRLMSLSEEACVSGALVVWPESAAWPLVFGRDRALAESLADLQGRGCSVILNSMSEENEKRFNSAYLVDADGSVERYDKRHLVPFGEYVPLRRVFPFLRRLARAAGDFSPGDSDRLLHWEQERLALAICFEIVFPGEVAARVRDGATMLVTITNDAWYGDTAAPWQHLRAARFRAAENRRPLIRAALTGISVFVSERGEVDQALGVGETGVLKASILGRRQLTLFSRLPWLIPAVCGVLLAFAILRPVAALGDRAQEPPRGTDS